jgi:exopolysaccharide biosynthesis protein/GH25 family lysozyme M1 (1,4-beta-N-acetylmuramidase)
MRSVTPAVIIRAGQNLWKDVAFDISWSRSKLAGLLRGSYWFYDSRAKPRDQALKWASVLGNDRGELPLFADFEDRYGGNYGKWQDWKYFLQSLKEIMPDKEISIYTAYYYFREKTISVGIPSNELELFKQYPLWIANYNTTSPLVPRPWTEWHLWQHTDKGDGSKYGVASANIDLNYFDGTEEQFIERFSSAPKEEPINLNLEYQKVRRFGSDCHIVIVDLNKYKVLATNTNGNLVRTSSVSGTHRAKYAINGDGWMLYSGYPYTPISIASSEGVLYQPNQFDFRPYINITSNKAIEINHNKRVFYNTISGTRYLIQNGVKSPALSENKIENIERHPRSATGRNHNGKLVMLVVDGRSSLSSGVTLSELADIMIECRCSDAIELDGGGSSTMVLDGKVANIPSDPSERPVVNHLLLMQIENKNNVTLNYKSGNRKYKEA